MSILLNEMRSFLPKALKIGAFILSPILVLMGVILLSGSGRPKPPPSGVIPFPAKRPVYSYSEAQNSSPNYSSLEKFRLSLDSLNTWDKNPWRERNEYWEITFLAS